MNKEIRKAIHEWLVNNFLCFTQTRRRPGGDKVDLFCFLPGLPFVQGWCFRKEEREEIEDMLKKGELWKEIPTATLVAAIDALPEDAGEQTRLIEEAIAAHQALQEEVP